MGFRHIPRPSRRGVIVFAFALLLAAALASALTAKIAVDHYSAEHASSIQALGQHDQLVTDRARLEQLSEKRLTNIQRLESRLASTDNDLTYAASRWHALQRRVAALRTTTALLQSQLSTAKADAKSSYDTGYEAGLADAASSSSEIDSGYGDCDPNYEGACVPTGYGDVDCADVVETDFDVVGYDIYGLDGDDDGIACESY